MEISGLFGKEETHEFILAEKILEEFQPKPISREEVQRPINRERVLEIYRSIASGKSIQAIFTFTIAILGKNRVLVDGQHRMEALRMLDADVLQGVHVHLRLIPVPDMDSAVRLRDELGKAVPVDPVGSVHGVKCQNMFQSFLEGCDNHPSASSNPRYGNWSKDIPKIMERTGFFNKFETAERFMREILDLNTYIFDNIVRHKSTLFFDFITDSDKNKQEGASFKSFREKYSKKNPSNVMCLGLIVRNGFMEIILDKMDRYHESYGSYFKTVCGKRPFRNMSFNSFPSKEVMKETLDAFFGGHVTGVEQIKMCPVCCETRMNREDSSTYHFGHIIARSRGGGNVVSNLIPVCPRCNLACKSENMNDYCKRVYERGFTK
jgi:hypothetical protein